jgi:hypothetical protein
MEYAKIEHYFFILAMAEITHESEDYLIDFDVIEQGIIDQKRNLERESVVPNPPVAPAIYRTSQTSQGKRKIHFETPEAPEAPGFPTNPTDEIGSVHEEMGAFWHDLHDDGDDDNGDMIRIPDLSADSSSDMSDDGPKASVASEHIVGGWNTGVSKDAPKDAPTGVARSIRRASKIHRDRTPASDGTPMDRIILMELKKLHRRIDGIEQLLSDFHYVVDSIADIRLMLNATRKKQ